VFHSRVSVSVLRTLVIEVKDSSASYRIDANSWLSIPGVTHPFLSCNDG